MDSRSKPLLFLPSLVVRGVGSKQVGSSLVTRIGGPKTEHGKGEEGTEKVCMWGESVCGESVRVCVSVCVSRVVGVGCDQNHEEETRRSGDTQREHLAWGSGRRHETRTDLQVRIVFLEEEDVLYGYYYKLNLIDQESSFYFPYIKPKTYR